MTNVVCNPSLFCWGEGVWTSYQIFKNGSLTRSQFLDGGCWVFYIKTKIWNIQWLWTKMFVSTKTMNLNCEILTKNLVTFKIIEVHRKSPFLGRRITKNQYIGGNCLKRRRGGGGGLGQFADLRGGLTKKSGWGFRRGGGGDAHYGRTHLCDSL